MFQLNFGLKPVFGFKPRFETLVLTKDKVTHCVSKKVPTFELSVTLSNLNRFSKFLHCRKAYEICYKPMWPTSP